MKPGAALATLVAALLAAGVQAEQGSHGSGHGQDHVPKAEAAASGPFEARGIFLGFDEEERRIAVAHEAVPEVMKAMRMRFVLPEEEPVPTFAPGESIAFEMFSRVEVGKTWYAKNLEPLPEGVELELPEALREQIGH